jgi:hypothetical protein
VQRDQCLRMDWGGKHALLAYGALLTMVRPQSRLILNHSCKRGTTLAPLTTSVAAAASTLGSTTTLKPLLSALVSCLLLILLLLHGGLERLLHWKCHLLNGRSQVGRLHWRGVGQRHSHNLALQERLILDNLIKGLSNALVDDCEEPWVDTTCSCRSLPQRSGRQRTCPSCHRGNLCSHGDIHGTVIIIAQI